MDRSSIDWEGPMVAVVTNFDQRGEIDEKALSKFSIDSWE